MEDRSSPELSMRSFQHHHPPGPPICTTSFCPPWRLIEDAKRPAINGKNGIGLEARKRRKKRENERERSRVCFQTNIKESRRLERGDVCCVDRPKLATGEGWVLVGLTDRPPADRRSRQSTHTYLYMGFNWRENDNISGSDESRVAID